MPLKEGSGKETIIANIATEVRAGKDSKQAAAIAYAKARGDVLDAVAAMADKVEGLNRRADSYCDRASKAAAK